MKTPVRTLSHRSLHHSPHHSPHRSAPDSFSIRRRALLLAALAPCAASAASDKEELRGLVDQTIRPLMSQHGIPGMAVGLVVGGHDHVFTYGVASRESDTPVTEATIFEIGSISKTFTAALAAWGQVTGQLSLAAHPSHYLAALKGRAIDRATLLHLATYTAGGLPLQFPDTVAGEAGVLRYFQTWKPGAQPGAVRQYSNPSLGLLGLATATAMRERFDRLIETRLLQPLGLRHTYLSVPAAELAHYAWGYRDGRPVRVSPGPLDAETYGIKSTAPDMLRWLRAHMDPTGLDRSLGDALRLTHIGRFKVGSMVQGLGWEQFSYPVSREALLAGNSAQVIFDPQPVTPVPGVAAPGDGAARLFDKTGSTGGFGAYAVFVPARKLGLVMLANKSYPIPARIEAAYAILDLVARNA
ncbi:class C beta-lactamase [Ideonella sp. DXS29W]|uniref:Beta-lactamase n=1 Tax=Ideonella lacteola TaxID=2984193 RepID=A0ABU9BY95_9BURK